MSVANQNDNKPFILKKLDGTYHKIPITALTTRDIFSLEKDQNASILFNSITINNNTNIPLINIGYCPTDKIEFKKISKKNVDFELSANKYRLTMNIAENFTVFDARSFFSDAFLTVPKNILIKFKDKILADNDYLLSSGDQNLLFEIIPADGFHFYYSNYGNFNYILMDDNSTLQDLNDTICAYNNLFGSLVNSSNFETLLKKYNYDNNSKLTEISKNISFFDFEIGYMDDIHNFTLSFNNSDHSFSYNNRLTLYYITCALEKKYRIDRKLFIPLNSQDKTIPLSTPIPKCSNIKVKIREELHLMIEKKHKKMPYMTKLDDLLKEYKFDKKNFGIIINNHFAYSSTVKNLLIHFLNNGSEKSPAEIIFNFPKNSSHVKNFKGEDNEFKCIVEDEISNDRIIRRYFEKSPLLYELKKEDQFYRAVNRIQPKITFNYLKYKNDKCMKNKEITIKLKGDELRVADLIHTVNLKHTKACSSYEVCLNLPVGSRKVEFWENLNDVLLHKNIEIKRYVYQDYNKLRVCTLKKCYDVDPQTAEKIISGYDNNPSKYSLYFNYNLLRNDDFPSLFKGDNELRLFQKVDSKEFLIANDKLHVTYQLNKSQFSQVSSEIIKLFKIQDNNIQFSFSPKFGEEKKTQLPRKFDLGCLPPKYIIFVNYDCKNRGLINLLFDNKPQRYVHLSDIQKSIKELKSDIFSKMNILNYSLNSLHFYFCDFKLEEENSFVYYYINEGMEITLKKDKNVIKVSLLLPENKTLCYYLTPGETIEDLKKLIKLHTKYEEDFELRTENGEELVATTKLLSDISLNLICNKIIIHQDGSLGKKDIELSEILSISYAKSCLQKMTGCAKISLFIYNKKEKCYKIPTKIKRLYEFRKKNTDLFVHKLLNTFHLNFQNSDIAFTDSKDSECNSIDWVVENIIAPTVKCNRDKFNLLADGKVCDINRPMFELIDKLNIEFKFYPNVNHDEQISTENPSIPIIPGYQNEQINHANQNGQINPGYQNGQINPGYQNGQINPGYQNGQINHVNQNEPIGPENPSKPDNFKQHNESIDVDKSSNNALEMNEKNKLSYYMPKIKTSENANQSEEKLIDKNEINSQENKSELNSQENKNDNENAAGINNNNDDDDIEEEEEDDDDDEKIYTYNFQIFKEPVTQRSYKKSATIKDAISDIAHEKGVNSCCVSILFAGKTLKKDIVIKKLNLNNKDILQVFIRDIEDILLQTAKALTIFSDCDEYEYEEEEEEENENIQ